MKTIFIFFQLLFQVLLKLKESKISNLNLLLPISSYTNVSYKLQSYNGCYQWMSSNPEVLSVNTLQHQDSCQNQVIVRVETNKPYHNMIWITAKDTNSGIVLSCEVRLATIKKLEILTKQKTVLVGDYETLELLGYDYKGNVFSTLEGLKFNWNIQQTSNFAQYQTFLEANKKTSQKRHLLEENGHQSDVIILKGQQTGQVRITATINDSLNHNTSTSQNLEIIEHFVITPQNDLFLLPCDQIQFKLYLLYNNNQDIEINQVSLPNKDFEWKLQGDDIGRLGNDGHLYVGKNLGIANLVVKDLRNNDNQIQNTIQVVQPWQIKMFITEYNQELQNFMSDYKNQILNPIEHYIKQFDNNWNLLQNRKYIIQAFIVDKNDNLVTIQNYNIQFKYQSSQFYLHSQKNDSIVLEAMNVGNSKISAQMENHDCLDTFKETHQSIIVYSQIKIFKYIKGPIYLPYHKEQNHNQMYQLKAIGGSGRYEWQIKNEELARIDMHDQLHAYGVGKTKILVRDVMNKHNQDSQELIITQLQTQEFFEPKIELLLNEQKDIFITAYDKQKHIYSNCTDYQISLHLNENFDYEHIYNYKQLTEQIQNYLKKYQLLLPQIVQVDYIQPSEYQDYIANKIITKKKLKQLYEFYQNFGICQSIKVKPLSSNVKDLTFRSYDNQIKNLPVKVYKQSNVLYPENYDKDIYGEQVLIAQGSSATFFIKDGNESWLQDIPINSRVLKKGEDFYSVQIGKRTNGLLPVTVKCLSLGEQTQKVGKFSVITQNINDQQLYSPLEIISNIEFICAIPKSIKIIAKEKQTQNPKTYLQNIHSRIILKNDQSHQIMSQMFNSDHIPFYNATSIEQQWDLTSYNNGKLQKTLLQGEVILDLNDRVGELVLKVQAQRGANNLHFPLISDEVHIESKKLLTIIPSFYVLYNHQDNYMDFDIQNGSGDFTISVSNENLVDYEFLPNQKIIRVKPKKQGELILKVLDNNLTFQNTAESKIIVVNIDAIKLKLSQKIALKGEQIPVQFELQGSGQNIPKDQLRFADLQIQTDNNGLEVDNENFIIHANQEGIYHINLKSKNDGTVSNTIEFQVFNHIKTFPNKINLIAGCIGYFQIEGGPNKSLRKQEGYEIQIQNPNKKVVINQLSEDLYEIKANKQMQESIKIILISKKMHKEISSTILDINIGKIEDLNIRSSNVIHQGATSKLFAIPQINYSDMSISKCKLNYTIGNNSAGAFDIGGYVNQQRQMTDLRLSILAVEVKGVKQGEGSIDIELAVEGQQIIKRQFYIQVEDSYVLPSSGFINQKNCLGSFLLLKPNSLYQLPKESSLYSQYQIIQHDGATQLQNRNQLKTFSKLGNDFLLKKFQNQSQNELSVKVQNPFVLVAEQSSHLTYMNNLSRTVIPLTYLDNFGRKFYTSMSPEKIYVLVSNPDILNAFIDTANQQLVIDTKSIGTSLIYLQDNDQQFLFDIFQISVGSLIAPEGNLNVLKGASIRFANLQKNDNNIWKSTNDTVLKIDTNGHAIALQEGQAQVTFDESLFLSQNIKVYDIINLKPIDQNPNQITDIKSHQDYQTHYKIYFQAYSNEGKLTLSQSDLIQQYKDIVCKVKSEGFSVQKVTDQITKGLFGCQVTMRDHKQKFVNQIEVFIYLYTDQNQTASASSSYRLNVLKSFADLDNKNLNIKLNKSKNKKKLLFQTDHPLELNASPELQPYIRTKFDNSKQQYGVQIVIPNSKNESFNSSFIIHSPKTHEKQTYRVQYNSKALWFDGLQLSSKEFGVMDLLILIGCIVLLYMILQHKCFNKKNVKDMPVNHSTTNYSNSNINTFLNKTYTPVTLNDPLRRELPSRSMLSNNY